MSNRVTAASLLTLQAGQQILYKAGRGVYELDAEGVITDLLPGMGARLRVTSINSQGSKSNVSVGQVIYGEWFELLIP